jgi:hypothetical protein
VVVVERRYDAQYFEEDDMKVSVLGMGMIMGLALAGLGCGEEGADATPFVGAWKYTSGTETTNCGGQSTTDMLTGNVSLQKGIASPLVSVDNESGCNLALDVTGSTASARSGQECMVTESGIAVTIKITAYSFTVNGVVADESRSASYQFSGPTGNVNCTYTSTGRLMKVSQ